MRKPHGFTLIELLVVVSIIVLLIAMLLPALREANISAKRTVCQTRQRLLTDALTSYAISQGGFFPTSEDKSRGWWAESYDLRRSFPWSGNEDRPPLGMGLLVQQGNLSEGGLGSVIHCPTFDNTKGPYAGHCDDIQSTWGYGGSGFSQFPQQRVIGSYNYRGRSYELLNNAPPRLKSAASNFTTIVDAPDLRFRGHRSLRNAHRGYNFALGDGSVAYFADENFEIDDIVAGDFDGNPPIPNEAVYNYLADLN